MRHYRAACQPHPRHQQQQHAQQPADGQAPLPQPHQQQQAAGGGDGGEQQGRRRRPLADGEEGELSPREAARRVAAAKPFVAVGSMEPGQA